MAELKLTSLDDLKPVDVEVRIERPGGDVMIVPMRTMTYGEYLRYGHDVPNPAPPINGVDKNGRPVFDHNDPGYQRALEDVAIRRNLRRLVAILKIEIPGSTIDEQVDNLDKALDANTARQLINLMTQLANKGEAQINARAESFHPNGTADTAGDETAPDDAEPVVEPAGKRAK